MKSNHITLLLLLMVFIFFMSCKDRTFTKTKSASVKIHSLVGTSSVKVKSYTLTYNPKGNGFIRIELESGAEYQAKSVDGGSFSSINSLLKEQGVLFDTVRKELIINKSTQP